MADRYWISGSGTWSRTNTAVWSATPNGGGGASVPTSEDDVYFQNPGTYTVTVADINGSVSCKSLNFTGFTGTLAGSTTLGLYGSLTAVAEMTWTHTGAIFFIATGAVTLTSGGKTLGPITVSSMSVTVELQAALTSSGAITVAAGTFTTNNYNVSATSLVSSNTNLRTINLGSSTITLSASGAAITVNLTNSTNLTFNAGTSQFILTSTSAAVNGSGIIFHNVRYASTSISNVSIGGTGNTFNNLEVVARTAPGVSSFSLAGDQTINGTLILTAGTAPSMRTYPQSTVMGTSRTLTCAAVSTLSDVDFRDIAIAGAATPVSGTRLGDCKGNSGITFPAAKTVYLRAANSANWGDVSSGSWSSTLGGTATVDAFPLAQDTAVISTYPTTAGSTITINGPYSIGTIDMSARTSNAMTLFVSLAPAIFGDWINGSGVTLSGSSTITFSGRGSQKITSAGKTFTQSFTVYCFNGSVTLQDAFITNRSLSTAFNLASGTFDLNSYTATLSGSGSAFRADTTTLARSLNTGSGTLIIAGTGGFSVSNATNFTCTGTGTISLTSASAKTFAGGGVQTYPTLNQGGAGALTVTGSNMFANITNTYSAIGATSVLFTSNTTNEFTAFNLTGTAGKVCTLGSTLTSPAFLKKSSIWYVGANSTNGAGNSNLNFAAGDGIDYLSISYITGVIPSTGNFNFFAFF